MDKKNSTREVLLKIAIVIRNAIRWDYIVDVIFIYAYFTKFQHKALVDVKRSKNITKKIFKEPNNKKKSKNKK